MQRQSPFRSHSLHGEPGFVKGILALIVFVGIIVNSLGSLAAWIWTEILWPAGLASLASGIAYWWTRKRRAAWAAGLCRVLLPITIGFGVDWVTLLVLNSYSPSIDESSLRAMEDALVRLRIAVHNLASPGLLVLSLILGGLLVANYFFPRLKLVTRFAAVEQILASILLALTAATTFTLFSAEPMERWAGQETAVLKGRYELNLRNEWDGVSQFLAARILSYKVQQLTPSDRRILLGLQKEIQTASGNVSDTETKAARRIAENNADTAIPAVKLLLSRIGSVSDPHKENRPAEGLLDAPPATFAQWDEQKSVVKRQENRAAEVKQEASQAKLAFATLLQTAMSNLAPGSETLFGAYSEVGVDKLSELISDKLSESWTEKKERPDLRELETDVEGPVSVARETQDFLIPGTWRRSRQACVDCLGTISSTPLEIKRQVAEVVTSLKGETTNYSESSDEVALPRGFDLPNQRRVRDPDPNSLENRIRELNKQREREGFGRFGEPRPGILEPRLPERGAMEHIPME